MRSFARVAIFVEPMIQAEFERRWPAEAVPTKLG